jgi:1,4-alpha-glucan branching enzyme
MNFYAITGYSHPGLYVWRPGSNVRRYVVPASETPDENGWFCFVCELDSDADNKVSFKLFQRNDDDSPSRHWEGDEHNRTLPRDAKGRLPQRVWFSQGSARVLIQDPLAQASDTLRIHLVTRNRYLDGELFMWRPDQEVTKRIRAHGTDAEGPFWDLDLSGPDRHLFNFKFLSSLTGVERFEPAYANRVYCSHDGPEIWTHSEGLDIATSRPLKEVFTVNYKQHGDLAHPATMHLWQESSDFVTDLMGIATSDGWWRYEVPLYTGIPYQFKFRNYTAKEALRWEHGDATRTVVLGGAHEVWTLEGDRHLFDAQPQPDRRVTIRISHRPPDSGLSDTLRAHVWVNQARGALHEFLAPDPEDPDKFQFLTYPHVTTSLKFTDGTRWEKCPRHAISFAEDESDLERHVVLGRSPLLEEPPPLDDLFADPAFSVRRPGAYPEDGHLRFVLHAPDAARVRLVGDWTDGLEMQSTKSGVYWWASVPIAEVESRLPPEHDGNYHRAKYRFLLNDRRSVQDPAAGWVEQSSTRGNSRLVKPSSFHWHDHFWQTPGWDYLVVYQVHPQRFSNRFADDPPLIRVAKEIHTSSGYLKGFGVTAILLMPVNEVGSNNSWGYDPAYFYAVENDLGGPDALKYLVDTCHQNGMAVLLDVVFNHAGCDDNVLWQVARDTYFDGDTAWGAMINFDDPQCRHFFEQNLVYWQHEFHIDGFRLDHTHTIVHSDKTGSFVREAGSGGGWEFLHGLRQALHRDADQRTILTAEHLPNDWSLTNDGGPMDSQWCDDFHDRLVDACKGYRIMPRLARAMQISHTECRSWHNVTNYAESHDEVGNVNDRIANVAGYGRGLRMSKVAAAASLLARGIPMFFMGAESGEHRQFKFGSSETLDLTAYQHGPYRGKVRAWWNCLCRTRRSESIKGPAKLSIRYAEDQLLAFSRGLGDDYFVVLNFGGWSGGKSLAELNLPTRRYRELWNSSWPAFAVENEDEHTNGGRDVRLHRGHSLHIPDYGVIVLERA